MIINQMIDSGIFPIFKKGDVNSLNNYRPISLLPAISKIFERLIYNQLYTYFANNNTYYLKNSMPSITGLQA